ncbi:hypothetical protein [Sedimentitalea todarodis]|uniref:Uncharacterized protein n=1 Tax=Sedimentitalea todarodis TaxID=1631240 RepID=A0ABU3VJN9_9RHOB|nr:hypothetical protein [Sedimentitalea todarodis]MDU9006345.1 hypothetical protein [Sedimentitalea todarodis]
MRIPPFAIVVILCGTFIAATQLSAQLSSTEEQVPPTTEFSQH